MTSTIGSPVRVWVEEGVLSALCAPCGVYAEHLAVPDDDAAQAFLREHPGDVDDVHDRRLPQGWVSPLSGPGALSQ